MDGRQDQIVLVEQRHAGLVAGGVRRIERQLGEEALARRIAAGDLLELDQVGAAGLGILVDAVEMRLVPEPRAFEVGRPVRAADVGDGARRKSFQSSPARGGAGASRQRRDRIGAAGHVVEHALRRGRADAGHQLQQPEAGDAVARVLDEAQQRQHVLDVGGVEEFQPAELDEGNVAAGQFDFQRAAVAGGAEQHRLLLQQRAGLRGFPARARRCSAPGRPRRARVTSCGLAPEVRSVHRFLVKRSRARSITPLAAARIGCVER